jgi:hypothetical protein
MVEQWQDSCFFSRDFPRSHSHTNGIYKKVPTQPGSKKKKTISTGKLRREYRIVQRSAPFFRSAHALRYVQHHLALESIVTTVAVDASYTVANVGIRLVARV